MMIHYHWFRQWLGAINISYNVTYINWKSYKIQIMMLQWPKISPSQQPKSLGISPNGFASKSLRVKIENSQVTWRKPFMWLGLQDRRWKMGPDLCCHIKPQGNNGLRAYCWIETFQLLQHVHDIVIDCHSNDRLASLQITGSKSLSK